MDKIGVLVVDDSAVVRQVSSQILSSDPGIELIGTAIDPIFAMDKMRQRWPDVIVLDIEMPRMDGLTFLRKIMDEHPTPVVICSSLTQAGAEITMEALAAGAVGIVAKPSIGVRRHLMEEAASELLLAVKAAGTARVRKLPMLAGMRPVPVIKPMPRGGGEGALSQTTERLVAIGSSTGGTQALEVVLAALPRTAPGIVIVQHMPEKFTASFAARLNSICEVEVREASHGDRVIPGCALIAPGGRHMMLKRSGAQYIVEVFDAPLVNRHRPSVDVLFRSVAKYAAKNAVGMILTGMGDDGARGLKEMFDTGAPTIAQDEASCVVYGMPKEAVRLGGAQKVLPLSAMAHEIMRYA